VLAVGNKGCSVDRRACRRLSRRERQFQVRKHFITNA